MNKLLIYLIVFIAVLVPLASIGYGITAPQSFLDSSVNHSKLNQEVRAQVTEQIGEDLSWAHYNGIQLNATHVVDNVLKQFYILENDSSFKSYYEKYSNKLSIGTTFDFNKSQLNNSDPYGLDMDSVSFSFENIKTIRNNGSNSAQIPFLTEDISYYINVGTLEIGGPAITIYPLTYSGGSSS